MCFCSAVLCDSAGGATSAEMCSQLGGTLAGMQGTPGCQGQLQLEPLLSVHVECGAVRTNIVISGSCLQRLLRARRGESCCTSTALLATPLGGRLVASQHLLRAVDMRVAGESQAATVFQDRGLLAAASGAKQQQSFRPLGSWLQQVEPGQQPSGRRRHL